MPDPQRRFTRRFLLAMTAYLVAAAAARWLLSLAGDSWLRLPAALLPLAPLVLAVYVFLGYLNAVDELQQKIQLNAIGLSASLTALLSLTVGFLEAAGFPRPSWLFIFPLMVAFWSLGLVFFNRRYS